MKRTLWILAATLLVATTRAATNDLTGLLQKGLFEEEANRNLDSAISNYQSLAAAFDKDRQVAATAIFRLGECYRKLGRTNEATAQYERLVRDFSDQQTLVTLSQQNLAGMKVAAPSRSEIGENAVMLRELAARCAAAEADHTQEEYLLKRLKALSREDLLKTLPTAVQDKQLETLVTQRNFVEQSLVNLSANYSKDHPNVKTAETTLTNINQKIDERMDASLAGLQAKSDSDAAMIASLKSEMRKLQGTGEGAVASQPESAITDEEEKEIRRIQQLIRNSPDLINAPNENVTPLSLAARQDQLRVATFLLDHGADIEKGAGILKPLVAAAENGHKAMVELLLKRGADVNGDPSSGVTPLSVAAHKGFVAVTEVLLAHKANVNSEDAPLISAAQNGQAKIMQMLLAAGAEVNIEYNGRTALSFAVEHRSLDAVKTLLDAKADPNAGKLDAPLLCAVLNNEVRAVELLLKAGANPNVKGEVDWDLNINGNGYGRTYNRRASVTPLWLAVHRSSDPVLAKLLLKYKADPNDSQTDGRPIAFNALYSSQLEILEALLDSGANVNACDNNFRPETPTLLDRAIFNTNATKLVLDHGADPNLRNENGATPLIYAALYCSQVDRSVFEMLLAHKADPNATQNGVTALDILKGRLAEPAGSIQRLGRPQSSEDKSQVAAIIELLRQHGALDDLPNFSVIRAITRIGAKPEVIFQASSNNWNRFTLLTTLRNVYRTDKRVMTGNPRASAFSFPDFKRIIIHRPNRAAVGKEQVIQVNLLNSTNGIDCAKDQMLEFGDVIEIPEREHSLAEQWADLSNNDRNVMDRCLTGSAKLKFRDQTADLTVYPFETALIGSMLATRKAQSVLMASSDLAHVKVTRPNGPTGKKQEWILDCSDLSKAPDLWVRDGDVIEVPEK